MKDKNSEEKQKIEKSLIGIQSPMRTLFRLTVNIKKSKNNSREKKKKLPFSSIFANNNNNQLNKVESTEKISKNEYNKSIYKPKHSSVDLKDNKINNIYNNNLTNSVYDAYIINNNNNNNTFINNYTNRNSNHEILLKCIYNNNNNVKNKNSSKINYQNNNLSPDLNDNNKLSIFTNSYMNNKNNNNNINTNVNNINTFNINNNNNININTNVNANNININIPEKKKAKNSKINKNSFLISNSINNNKTNENINNSEEASLNDLQNIRTSTGAYNIKLNKKLRKNNYSNNLTNKYDNKNEINNIDININNDNNNNKPIQKFLTKNYIEEIEMPITHRNSSYINFYNNILKNSDHKKNDNCNGSFNNTKYFNINKELNSNILNETLQPNRQSLFDNEQLYINDYNMRNNNRIFSPNQNIIFNIKKQSIKKVNNILINTKNIQLNSIYSPKRGLYRVHSQENVINKDIDQINSITENRVVYKNKSVKDGYTYSKKNFLHKNKNNADSAKKNHIYETMPKESKDIEMTMNNNNVITNNNLSNINYIYKNSDMQINSKDENLITKKDESMDYLDDKKYDIKPDIYPEIKINLRKGKSKKIRKNNSVIEDNNRYNISNFNKKNEKKNERNKPNQLYDIPSKNKSNLNLNDDNRIISTINNKNMSYNSFLSNTNKSVVCTNANLSITNNTLSDSNTADLISNKNLKYNPKEKPLTVNDLFYILILEEKIKDIADSLSLDNMEIISNYCFELINYIYVYSMNKYIESAICDLMDIKNIKSYNKYTTFSIILLYDLTFEEQKFNNMKILINELLKLIYSNIIMIINHSKNKINKNEENASILCHIINNIQSKYTHNNDLYLDDSEYLLIDQSSNFSCDEKIDYNMNFIIRNIHTIINNMKKTINYDDFLDLFKKINNVSTEDMNNFYRHKILKINFINSSLLSSAIIKNNMQYYANLKFPPFITTPSKKKYTLVISLDETLIHFKKGNIKTNQGIIQLRPGILEFFEAIKPYYEIILFCNGNKKYSDLIINSIDNKKKYIDHRLYREQCIVVNNDYVKDISKIGRPINKTIIVDNLPQNFRLNKENGINIKSFHGDNPNDKILFNLSKILVNIGKTNGDVREEIKKNWIEIINKVTSNVYNNYYCK